MINEGEQFVARDAIRPRRPIAPTIRRLDGRLEFLTSQRRLIRALMLQVIKELQEHDPGEQRQSIKVAVQPLVLAHDVARGLEKGTEGLGGGGGGGERHGAGRKREMTNDE